MAAWALLGVAGLAGLGFSLYRNDVLLGMARSGGWETRYLALEARLLGTPGWGTPRSLSAKLQSATPERVEAASPRVGAPEAATPTVAERAEPRGAEPAAKAPEPAAANDTAAKAPEPTAPAAASNTGADANPARATSDGVKIVSLDALATLPAATPSTPAAAPARAAASPVTRRSSENAAPSRAAAATPAPVAKAAVAKAPAAKAPVAKPPAPKAAVAAAPAANDNPLKAAIRSAISKEQGK